MSESVENLIEYCRANDRVCPLKLWKKLPHRVQTSGGGWEPPLPLILAAWLTRQRFQKCSGCKNILCGRQNTAVLKLSASFFAICAKISGFTLTSDLRHLAFDAMHDA